MSLTTAGVCYPSPFLSAQQTYASPGLRSLRRRRRYQAPLQNTAESSNPTTVGFVLDYLQSEVSWVLFLGICLDFSYSLLWVLLPQFGFHFDRGSVPQALVEPYLVPPWHPLKRRDFYLDNITPPASMDQLIFVRSVHVFRQSIVISVTNRSGGRLNPEFSKSLVVDNADVLLGFNRWLQHCCFELIVVVH